MPVPPGLPKRNSALKLVNAFSIIRRTFSFHTIATALGSVMPAYLRCRPPARVPWSLDYSFFRARAELALASFPFDEVGSPALTISGGVTETSSAANARSVRIKC